MAATKAPQPPTDTIMVCGKDSASTGGVVTAAAPLLAAARRVVFVGVAKRDDGRTDALGQVARQVAASEAEVRVVPPDRRDIPEALAAAAEECGADLVVMGAYGRSRAPEVVFGSCTDAVLSPSRTCQHVERPHTPPTRAIRCSAPRHSAGNSTLRRLGRPLRGPPRRRSTTSSTPATQRDRARASPSFRPRPVTAPAQALGPFAQLL